jgi:CelD/BcsL family acetyltransferase involved in cellulose biosynthesis
VSRQQSELADLADLVEPKARATQRFGSEVVTGIRVTGLLCGELDDLADRCGAPAMARAAWLAPSGSGVAGGRAWMVVVRDDQRQLRAALTVVDQAHGDLDLVTLAGCGSGQIGTILADDAGSAALLAHAFAEAMQARPRPALAALGPIDPEAPNLADFLANLPGAELADYDAVPVISRLGSRMAADYLSPSMRRTLRKAANRIHADGVEISVQFSSDCSELLSMLPALERMHRERDHDQGRESELDDPTALDVWRSRLDGLAREGSLEVATLVIDGALAAYVIGIVDADEYRVLEGVLATPFSRYSPGRVLETAVWQRVLDDPALDRLDWMTSIASEALLATNDARPVSVVRAAFPGQGDGPSSSAGLIPAQRS